MHRQVQPGRANDQPMLLPVLAREYGINRVARTLGLDYVTLKFRLLSSDTAQAKTSPTVARIDSLFVTSTNSSKKIQITYLSS